MHDRILILDFGSQVTQLIARRVREMNVFCEIHPYDVSDAFVRAFCNENGLRPKTLQADVYEALERRTWPGNVRELKNVVERAAILGGDEITIADLLAMDRTTLTANLKPLERRGLIEVAIDKDDKRSRRLIITPAGRALLAKAYPIWRDAHTALEFKISHGSADDLRRMLGALL